MHEPHARAIDQGGNHERGYTKVFVSLDGTEQQDFVLARAIKVAANNGAKLIIGHVIDSTALESAGSIRSIWSTA